MKPTLKAEISGGAAIIKFDKQGMEGVKIYCKRGNEASFSFLEKDVESPYTDDRPKLESDSPEERNYYAFYIEHDDEVGLQSDIVTVIVP